jgi:hypothetical protein
MPATRRTASRTASSTIRCSAVSIPLCWRVRAATRQSAYRPAGRGRASHLLASDQPANEARDLSCAAAWKRAGMGWTGRTRAGRRGRRVLSICRLQRPDMGPEEHRIRFGRRCRRQGGCRGLECHRSQPEAVLRPRRQAPDVPRMERSARRTAQQRQLLHARRRLARRREIDQFDSSVHDAGHQPLRRRRWTQHLRPDEGDRSVGGTGTGAIANPGPTPRMARSIAHGRCAPIRGWRGMPAPAAWTTRRILSLARLRRLQSRGRPAPPARRPRLQRSPRGQRRRRRRG